MAAQTRAFLGKEKELELSQDRHCGWQGITADIQKL
jgi:hypothetical protein